MDRQRLKEIMQDCLHEEVQNGEFFGSQYGQKNKGETPHE
jgi:hypothetical protein